MALNATLPHVSHFPQQIRRFQITSLIAVLVYEKADRTVHVVVALPPEDSRIIQRCSEDRNRFEFPLLEEAKLAARILKAKEKHLAWTENEQRSHSAGIAENFLATEEEITLATFFVQTEHH
jgi:hypothetical protein